MIGIILQYRTLPKNFDVHNIKIAFHQVDQTVVWSLILEFEDIFYLLTKMYNCNKNFKKVFKRVLISICWYAIEYFIFQCPAEIQFTGIILLFKI
jgi:hypothetical protein